ncbi:hypothetical protein [Roseateles noduli]|uniref:hypothetical protein n=1 Tax=Roseateles noduli TaxID=2052484 RepID=UPI003D648E68
MSSFLVASPLAPDGAFDPHFGFAPGIEPDLAPVAPAKGVEAGRDPARILASACADLSAGASALGATREAALFGDLPARTEDVEDPASESDRKTFFQGEGAALLQALARLAVDPAIAALLRREQLVLAAEAIGLCVRGCVTALRDAVHRLSCAAGGATQAAALRRTELIRQTLIEVVRATVGRDPDEGFRSLANYESHYVTALEQRLRLPFAPDQPHDRYFDAGTLAPEIVTRARLALRQRVTPTAVARSLAEEALERLRARLGEAGVNLACVWPATADQQAVIDEEIVAIERALGPVDRWALFHEDADSGQAGLLSHPTWLAVQVLLNLMHNGALPARAIDTRLAWTAADGPHRLRQLGEGLWWVQTGRAEDFDPGEALPVRVRQLRELDHEETQGPPHRRRLGAAEREGLARMPILFDTEDALRWITPHWLVTDELTGIWWRRMGEARCKDWLQSHRTDGLPADLRHRLMLAADAADQAWAFARLLPRKEEAAARAWLVCDGPGIVAAAVRRDDVTRLQRWQVLLLIAAPALGARQRGRALVARDDHGQAALARAMSLPHGADTVRELVATMLAIRAHPRPAPLSMWPPFNEILAGGDADSLGAIGVALAEGRAAPLQAFLDAVEVAHERGVLTHPEVRGLLMGLDDADGPGHWCGFEYAMARNHADVIVVWTQALIGMARQGVLDGPDLFDALKVPRVDGSGVYHQAMREGSCEAAASYRDALHAARTDRLLSRDQVSRLLLGERDEPQPLWLAAAAGHARAVAEHLREELTVLDLGRFFDVEDRVHARWYRRGGHVAIGAAMRYGQVEVVALLTGHALALQRALWRGALFPSFEGGPGDTPAIVVAVTAGHVDAVSLWMGALVRGVDMGWICRRDMLALIAAKDRRGVRLFHMAALVLEPVALGELLDLTVETVRPARLRSSDLMRLLGPGRRQPSPLAAALLADRAGAVRQIGRCLLRLHGEGTLSSRDLHRLLALRGRPRWWGGKAPRQTPAADSQRPAAAIEAYVALIRSAVSRGWVDEPRARRWLQAWTAAPGTVPPTSTHQLDVDADDDGADADIVAAADAAAAAAATADADADADADAPAD